MEVLLDDSRHLDLTRPIDVLIVGSGYGGSVAAARLSAMAAADTTQRLRVVVLERGDEFLPGAFPDRFEQLIPQTRIERPLKQGQAIDEAQQGLDHALFDIRLSDEVTAIVGNGLGGGSLINAGVVERPEAAVFDRDLWPTALRTPARAGDATALDGAFASVERMLGAGPFVPTPAKSSALVDDLDPLSRAAGATPRVRPPNVAVTQGTPQPAPVPLTLPNSAGVRQAPCTRCGNCITGCNFAAKNTLPMNYLALAWQQGAELYTGATVLAVEPSSTDEPGWVVTLRRTHDRRERDVPGSVHRLTARRVVLCAGTFGTPQILHQSLSTEAGRRALGHLDPGSGGQLGKGVSCNGDGIAAIHAQAREMEVGSQGTDPLRSGSGRATVGPTATGMIDLRTRRSLSDRRSLRDRFIIQDGAVPYPFARLFEEAVTTFSAAHATADWNMRGETDAAIDDPLALNSHKQQRTQFLLLMGHDDAGWHMQFTSSATRAGDGRHTVALTRVSLAPRQEEPSFKTERCRQNDVDKVVSALARGRFGGRYVPNPLWSPAPADLLDATKSSQQLPSGEKAVAPVLAERSVTVHPLGGCRMADSAERGVVNSIGQVFSSAVGTDVHDSLVVLDGSIVPTSLGINPLLTIAALADRACDALAQTWGLTQQANPPAKPPPQLPPPVAPLPWRRVPTAVRFRESMTGGLQLTVDPVPAWTDAPSANVRRDVRATLTVSAEVDDLEDLLRDPRHAVSRATAELDLLWFTASLPTPDAQRRETARVKVAIPTVSVTLLEPLPSNREERVWRAMRHWLHSRGRAELHDWIVQQGLRRRALRLLLWMLSLESRSARQSILFAVEKLPLPPFLGRSLQKTLVGLLKVASHHGEARVLRYDLGTVAPPAGVAWPFSGPVRILTAKRVHYGDGPGYRQRPSTGALDPWLPPRVPTHFWRALHELHVLVIAEGSQGEAISADDWPVDQWPADIRRQDWRVLGRGTWTVNNLPLLTTDMPQLRDHATLADAWVDTASLAAFVARCFLQSSFWRLRLPHYPTPLPSAPNPPAQRLHAGGRPDAGSAARADARHGHRPLCRGRLARRANHPDVRAHGQGQAGQDRADAL
ncbi:GMC oxidoreductase [Aquabacterium sp. J223]|uniref:GMC oxidoreductase n=1 Tax=Aquabacterium sp. J223 TaxID=2898431 RepID=UPI0021ADABC1|nr:GMC oxidoreductase [Aquabacterium sp. J223]UUX95792.1 GMC oxidoreductase [Aquabacterium sp. J223]